MALKILIKYPSKGRAKLLISTLSKSIALAEDLDNVTYLLTMDDDDPVSKTEAFDNVINKLRKKATIQVEHGKPVSKIYACNRDMDKAPDWDIVVLMSDDMICIQKGWDNIIRSQMESNFPDLDGVLHFSDGFVGRELNTMCILGRKYYDRFGYIYHPSYKSLWCDNEFMIVSQNLNKAKYFDRILFKHEHPANIGDLSKMDQLYNRNDRYFHEDKRNFERRKK